MRAERSLGAWRIAIMITLGLAFATLLALVTGQLGPLLAYYRLQDITWLRSASPREQRETAHQALRFVFGARTIPSAPCSDTVTRARWSHYSKPWLAKTQTT